MKLKLAFKCLPYILIEKDLGGTTLGSSKAFFVWLDDNPADTTDEHEEMHVLIWYVSTAIVALALHFGTGLHPYFAILAGAIVDPLLGTFFKPWKLFDESFAYAWATKHKARPQRYLDDIAKPNSTQSKRYGKDFHKLVRKIYRWFE